MTLASYIKSIIKPSSVFSLMVLAALPVYANENPDDSNNVGTFKLASFAVNHPKNLTPTDFLTTEASNQYGFGLIKAYYSMARGYDGSVYNRNSNGTLIDNVADSRVRIAFLDTGVDLNNLDLDGNIIGAYAVTCRTTGCVAGGDDSDGHGTMVAGVAAAEKNNSNIHGIAPRAQIIPINVLNVSGGSEAEGLRHAIMKGAKVINSSFGLVEDGTDKEYPIVAATTGNRAAPGTPSDVKAYLNAANTNTTLRAAIKYAISKHAIMVFAAGNASMNQVNVLAGIPYYFRGNISGAPSGYTTVNPNKEDWSKNWVAVVAVGKDKTISSFSNRCGIAKDWCIAAAGDDIRSTRVNTNSTIVADGTSFAAPQVSGALAVLIGAFPHLIPEKVTQIMFKTATDIGATGVDVIYGHGLLNMNSATTPTNSGWVLATSGKFSTNTKDFNSSALKLGASFGDAAAKLSKKKIMFLDEYERDFLVPLDSLAYGKPQRRDGTYLLSAFGEDKFQNNVSMGNADVKFSLTEDSPADLGESYNDGRMKMDKFSFTMKTGNENYGSEYNFSYGVNLADVIGFSSLESADNNSYEFSTAFKNPYLGFAQNANSAAYGFNQNGTGLKVGFYQGDLNDDDYDMAESKKISGAVTELNAGGEKYNLSFVGGLNIEERSFLGAEADGAFGLDVGTPTLFGGVAGKYDLSGKLSLMANYNIGMTKPNAVKNSLIENIDTVYSDSFAVGINYDGVTGKNDSLSVSLSQPLRVMSGSADVKIPLDVMSNGNVYYDRGALSLSPSGRELDVETYYKLNLDESSNLKVGSIVRFEPDHVKNAEPEAIGLVKYQLSF